MTLKRKRAQKARKVVKSTGIAYGLAIRLIKDIERNGSISVCYHDLHEWPIVVPSFGCECCGADYNQAKLVGPKGTLKLNEIS